MLNLYKHIIRPLLFSVDPEKAQHISDYVLKDPNLWKMAGRLFAYEDPVLRTSTGGITLSNPIGLAAGFDKDCRILPSMELLGFGYVTGGTITKAPRPGNTRPRVIRVKDRKAIINSLGFPGSGLEEVITRLSAMPITESPVKRILSISGTESADICECHRRLEIFASGIEVNISSPNTDGLRIFQQPANLRSLIDEINQTRKSPLFIKLPPFGSLDEHGTRDDEGRDNVLELVLASIELGVNAVTIANTWPVEDSRLAVGRGGLSGGPLFPNTLSMVKSVSQEFGDKIDINACGGISTGQDIYQVLKSGASTVQVYTSLVYEGPGLIKRMKKELAGALRDDQVFGAA
jgi:dihydroorotate dehydrogenase subfamily 2